MPRRCGRHPPIRKCDISRRVRKSDQLRINGVAEHRAGVHQAGDKQEDVRHALAVYIGVLELVFAGLSSLSTTPYGTVRYGRRQ